MVHHLFWTEWFLLQFSLRVEQKEFAAEVSEVDLCLRSYRWKNPGSVWLYGSVFCFIDFWNNVHVLWGNELKKIPVHVWM